jgi:hypothetical protein
MEKKGRLKDCGVPPKTEAERRDILFSRKYGLLIQI